MHGYEAAYYAVKLSLEFFLAGINDHLGALAEDKFLDLQESPKFALENLLGVHLVHLTLVEKDHLEDGSVVFAHGDAATEKAVKAGAEDNIGRWSRPAYAQTATGRQTYPLDRHSPIIRSPFEHPDA